MANETSNDNITTSVLPGFMELTPKDQMAFDKMKDIIADTYKKFGFISIDTPAIERSEVLLAKAGGETEKQIYRFNKGENDLSLRFDLTIPLARYVSEHQQDLVFPFRRSQIAKVYRGERPQKGRFREFYQCDIDIIGRDSLSLMNDAEIPSIIYSLFSKLNFGPFVIKINNRKIINGLLESLGVANLSVDIMRTIDKTDKIGKDEVSKVLLEVGVPEKVLPEIFGFLEITGTNEEILSSLKNLGVKNEIFDLGVAELGEVVKNIKLFGVPDKNFKIDLSIARGLDYYTGTVYETTLIDYPQVGSVCSGGRFDNLAEKYTDKKFPGVGISIGLTRLFAQLKEAGIIEGDSATPTKVLVVPMIEDMTIPFSIASALRDNNIPTEVYFDDVKAKVKLAYANKLEIPFVILIGEDEVSADKYTLKDMISGEQSLLSMEEVVERLKIH